MTRQYAQFNCGIKDIHLNRPILVLTLLVFVLVSTWGLSKSIRKRLPGHKPPGGDRSDPNRFLTTRRIGPRAPPHTQHHPRPAPTRAGEFLFLRGSPKSGLATAISTGRTDSRLAA